MGILELYMGPMYSGKTTKLLSRIKQIKYLNEDDQVFIINHKLDNRNNNKNNICTHNNEMLESNYIYDNEKNILDELDFYILKNDYKYIIIDEGQFYKGLKKIVLHLLKLDFNIIIAGLDGDYKQNKFGEMIDLIPYADKYYKLYAICNLCDKFKLTPASFTKRINNDDNNTNQILVGGNDRYISVCREHL